MVRSSEAEAMIFEFTGENSMQETPLVCPVRVVINLGGLLSGESVFSYIRTDPSEEQVANLVPSGENLTVLVESSESLNEILREYILSNSAGVFPWSGVSSVMF